MQKFSGQDFFSGNFLVVSEQAWDWGFQGICIVDVIQSLANDTHLEKLRNT